MSEPETLSINVGDTIQTSEVMGKADAFQKIFQNPKNDPKIAGMCQVRDVETLQKLAPMAFEYSKQQLKPVLIAVVGFVKQ